MYAVIRTYSGNGARTLFDLVEAGSTEVESLMRAIKGFVSYSVARSGDGGFTVTICQDKPGTDESVRVAREWVAKNIPHGTAIPMPQISEGPVILHA
ncbi:MAG: hypothetical protein ACO4AL_09710 [Steroidobacteraceae bacterium]|jgi:hypothetical protein